MAHIIALPLLALAMAQVDVGDGTRFESAISSGDYAPCGLISLYLVSQIRGTPVEWSRLQELAGPPGPDGSYSFEALSRAGSDIGLRPIGVKVDRKALTTLPMPAIAQFRNPERPDLPPHLLVVLRADNDGVTLLDAPFPPNFLPAERLEMYWTGYVLVFPENESDAQSIQSSAFAQQGLGIALLGWGALGGIAIIVILLRAFWLSGQQKPENRTRFSFFGRTPLRQRQVVVAGCVAFAVIGGSLVAVGFYKWAHGQNPQCSIAQPVVDLGNQEPGEHLIRVPIANTGRNRLEIQSVTSNCSCAAVAKYPETIDSGEQAIINVQLKVTPGRRGVTFRVLSNDPSGPKTILISWQGATKPVLVPPLVDSSPVAMSQPYERSVALIYSGGKSALIPQLEKFECDSPLVHITQGANNPIARQFARSGLLTTIQGQLDLKLSVDPPPKPELVRSLCKLFFRFGSETVSVTLPISVSFVRGSLPVDVRSFVFSAKHASELVGQCRFVSVSNPGLERELACGDVPEWLECKILSRSPKETLMALQISKEPDERVSVRTIKIGITGDPESTVTLPVYTWVVEK
jgi:hypothetical protein